MGNWMNKPVIGSANAAGEKQSKGFFCDRADTLVAANSIAQTVFVIVYMAGVATFISAVNGIVEFATETIGGEESQAVEDATSVITNTLATYLYIPAAVSMVITAVLLIFTFWRDIAKGVKVYFLMCCVPFFSVVFSIIFGAFAIIVVGVGNTLRLTFIACEASGNSIDDILAAEGLEDNDANRAAINAVVDACDGMNNGINLMSIGVIVIEVTLWTMLIVSCIRGSTVRKDVNTVVYVQNPTPVVQVVQNYPAQPQMVYANGQQQQMQPMYTGQQPQPVYTSSQPPTPNYSQPPTPSNNPAEQQASVEMNSSV